MRLDCTYKGIANGDLIAYTDESGRSVRYDYRQFTADPYPFVEFNGKIIFGSICGTHESLCYWVDKRDEIRGMKNRGRIWKKRKIMSIWYLKDDEAGRNQMKRFIPMLAEAYAEKFHVDEDFYSWNIAVAVDNDNIIVTTVKDFIQGGHVEASSDELDMKRNRNDAAEAERLGKEKYNDWVDNSPYADNKYKRMMENKKNTVNLTEEKLVKMVAESVKKCLLEYDWTPDSNSTISSDVPVSNEEPAPSEPVAQSESPKEGANETASSLDKEAVYKAIKAVIEAYESRRSAAVDKAIADFFNVLPKNVERRRILNFCKYSLNTSEARFSPKNAALNFIEDFERQQFIPLGDRTITDSQRSAIERFGGEVQSDSREEAMKQISGLKAEADRMTVSSVAKIKKCSRAFGQYLEANRENYSRATGDKIFRLVMSLSRTIMNASHFSTMSPSDKKNCNDIIANLQSLVGDGFDVKTILNDKYQFNESKKNKLPQISESQIRAIVAESLMDTLKSYGSKMKDAGANLANKAVDGINNYVDARTNINVPEDFKTFVKESGWSLHKQYPDGSVRIIPSMRGISFEEMVKAIRQSYPAAKMANDGDYCLRVKLGMTEGKLNEGIKAVDPTNVVPEEVAKKYGFSPAYAGFGNDLELWESSTKHPRELLKALGISRFTNYNTNGSVRITVKVSPKKDEYTFPKRDERHGYIRRGDYMFKDPNYVPSKEDTKSWQPAERISTDDVLRREMANNRDYRLRAKLGVTEGKVNEAFGEKMFGRNLVSFNTAFNNWKKIASKIGGNVSIKRIKGNQLKLVLTYNNANDSQEIGAMPQNVSPVFGQDGYNAQAIQALTTALQNAVRSIQCGYDRKERIKREEEEKRRERAESDRKHEESMRQAWSEYRNENANEYSQIGSPRMAQRSGRYNYGASYDM